MIIERNVFQLKFGKAREAIEIWSQIMAEGKKNLHTHPPMRMLTDLSGPAYTLVLEMELKSFMEIGPKNYDWMTNDTFRELYQKFIPLCESSSREYYKIENEVG